MKAVMFLQNVRIELGISLKKAAENLKTQMFEGSPGIFGYPKMGPESAQKSSDIGHLQLPEATEEFCDKTKGKSTLGTQAAS